MGKKIAVDNYTEEVADSVTLIWEKNKDLKTEKKKTKMAGWGRCDLKIKRGQGTLEGGKRRRRR